MALGGGTFTAQNKILPGSYINFVSAARATATLSDRGIATIPYSLDWGKQGEIVEVGASDFQKNSLKLFGYEYNAPQLKGLREFFRNIRVAYLFRLGTGGTKAENTFAMAKYAGARGNALKIVIAANVDDSSLFDVSTYLDTTLVNVQTVDSAETLVDTEFTDWKKDAALEVTAGMPLSGGVNPTTTNADFQTYLDLVEQYSFNAIGCPSNDSAIKGLFTAFTKRLRDDQGVKFQCVVYSPESTTDYEGVIDVLNSVDTADGSDEWSAVYWTTGVVAGTNVNESSMNKLYNGEYTLNINYTQTQLEQAIKGGKYVFHRVGADIRVLADINSLVTVTANKGEDFKQNQTIRVIDQIGNDIAVLFNTKYLGVVPNDADGRISLWSDIVQHHEQLQSIRAIENFSSEDVSVELGDNKRSVLVNDLVTPVNAMAQLYLSCVVA